MFNFNMEVLDYLELLSYFNPLRPNVAFLYTPKTSENLSGIYTEELYEKGTLGSNWLKLLFQSCSVLSLMLLLVLR